MGMEINSKWLWAHLWQAVAEVEEEDAGVRSAGQDGMANEGSVGDNKETYIPKINIPGT